MTVHVTETETMTTDELSCRLRKEALQALEEEPELCMLLKRTVLAPGVETFEDAVASTVCYRMLLHPVRCPSKPTSVDTSTSTNTNTDSNNSNAPMFCPNALRQLFQTAFQNNTDDEEMGHSMSDAVRQDALAILDRDPACDTLLEVVLFYKGFAALVCHRAARRKWTQRPRRKRLTALFLQSQASAVFGVDIHPGASMGAGILLDHGTGIVIGETAFVGDGCTLLHGVTLGGTGKESGDRHPKVGQRVLIGAGASILGNITIGDGCKIGAGSVVLRPLPAGATAVGAPAKIIGRALESDPAKDMDDGLQQVGLLHKSESISMASTTTSTTEDDELSTTTTEEEDGEHATTPSGGCAASMCPFREYTKMAQRAPKGTITICTLRRLLLKEGCTEYQVGAVFFALDTKNVGYVHCSYFLQHCHQAIIGAHVSHLEPERIDAIVHPYLLLLGDDNADNAAGTTMHPAVTEILSC